MDENHQDKIGNNLTATKNTLRLPPLSLKDQKKLKHFQKKPFAVRTGLKGKTLWDWLQLLGVLAIPLVVAGATLLFGIQQADLAQQQHENDQKIANQQYEADKQSALDQQEATILQTYIDNIQNLLLNYNLLKSTSGDDVATLARARTLTALRGLDPQRKGILLNFLYEANLIGYSDHNTNKLLSSIIDLTGAHLTGADLTHTYLTNADLTNADLTGANLSDADLTNADLTNADLTNGHLSDAHLSDAHLSHANLTDAILTGADLTDAFLTGTDLSHAILSGSTVTQQQLDDVSSCKDTILPPGLTCHRNQ